MKVTTLGDMELRYIKLDLVKLEAGGQHYGTMEGELSGEVVHGELRLTNLAPNRTDNVNVPTLRGLLTTHDGVLVYVEMNGLSILRAEDKARVFITCMTFRTADERYTWLNTTFAIVEGVLKSGLARCRVSRVENDFDMAAAG